MFAGRDGDVVAVRSDRGLLSAPAGRKGGYSLDRWLEGDGDARKAKDASRGAGWRCDVSGCVTVAKGRTISIAFHAAALADDCERADILIAPMWLDDARRDLCPKPVLIIDRRDLWENGAHAIYLSRRFWGEPGGSIALATAARSRGERPWVISRHRKRVLPAVQPAGATLGDSAAPGGVDAPSVSSVSEDQ